MNNVIMKLLKALTLLFSFSLVSCDELQIDEAIEEVMLQENPKFTTSLLFRLSSFGVEPFSSNAQGMDIYNDNVMFQAGLQGNIIYVLDLEEGYCLGSFIFTAPDDEPSHMNNINCGEKFCCTDYYPLLYVSQTTNSHACFVLRLSNDATSYDLIQTIKYCGTQHHADSNYDWFIDIDNQFIYTYGKHDKMLEEREVVKFPFPLLVNSMVTYTDEDVLDSFILKNMSIYQGSRIIDGLLYAPVGLGSDQYPGRLKIIDIENKTLVQDIALNCGEPESIGQFKKGAIICGGGDNPTYYYIQL